MDRALVEFRHGRARPKHIQVPIAVLGGAAGRCPPAARAPGSGIRRGADDLRSCSRRDLLGLAAPVVHLRRRGGRRSQADAHSELRTGAAQFHHLCRAAGSSAPRHPLHFGSYLDATGKRRGDRPRPIWWSRWARNWPRSICGRERLGHSAPLIRVDIDPEMLADGHGAKRTCLADAGAFVSGLLDLCRRGDVARADGWGADEASDGAGAVAHRGRRRTPRHRAGLRRAEGGASPR